MKAKLFLLFLSVSLFINIANCEDLIKKAVKQVLDTVPELKKELEEGKPKMEKTKITKIMGQGLSWFKQHSEVQHYTGVHDNKLEGFLHHIRTIVNVPEVYTNEFVESLMLIEFCNFNEIVIKRFI